MVWSGSVRARGNGTRRERGRDLLGGSEPSRGARWTDTRLVSARIQAVAGRRRDPRVEHPATRDGLVPRRHGRGNGAGGRDASHRTCRVPRGAKSRDGFVRFLTARCPTDVAGRKREVLELFSQPNISYITTDQKILRCHWPIDPAQNLLMFWNELAVSRRSFLISHQQHTNTKWPP